MFDGLVIDEPVIKPGAKGRRFEAKFIAEAVEPTAGYGSCRVCTSCSQYASAGWDCTNCGHHFSDHN